MAGQQFIDPRTGKPVFIREGRAFLKDSAGNLFRVNPDAAADQILSGQFEPASPDEVHRRDVAKRAGDSAALAFGEGAVTGAFDAATAVGRVGAEALGPVLEAAGGPSPSAQPGQRPEGLGRSKDVSGRAVLEAVVAGGDEARAAEYAENARARAAESPFAAFGGRVVGEVAGTALGGGLAARALGGATTAATGSRIAGGVAAGVTEGAALGYAQANEDAYIENHELTADQALAGMGLGALFGGGVSLATGGAARVFGRKGTRGETPFDSPKLGPYRTRDEALERSAASALGTPPAPGLGSKLADALESAQSAVSGAERSTLKSFGAHRWDDAAVAGREMWRNREAILEGAAKQMRADLDDLAARSRDVMDEVVDADLKRSHIASKVSGDSAAQVGAARAELGRLAAEADELVTNVEAFGNRGVAKRIRQFVGELTDQAGASDDAADAFITLDRAKRGLQRWRKQLGRSAARSDDALLRQQADALGTRLEQMQERSRQLLMDEKLWGSAAADQRAINAAWEDWFKSNQLFNGGFLTRTGETFDGRGIFVSDPAKVSRFVRGMGRQESSLLDEQFRHHVAATQRLTEAIGNAFDVGAKSADVAAVRTAAKQIDDTLRKADETVRVANQIDAVIQAEAGSATALLGGAVGGGLLGGIPGAIAGAAFGVVARPGQLIRQAAAVQALGANVSARLKRGIGSYFKSFGTPQLPDGARETAKRLPAAGRRAATVAGVNGFARSGEDKRAAYERRTREVLDVVRSPEIAAQRVNAAIGPIAEHTPKLSGLMAMRTMAGATFLASKIPRPLAGASLTPHLEEVTASDSEIAEFARYWQGVTNPTSLVDELKNGTLTHEHVEAVKTVYPALFKEVQLEVLAELSALKKPPPYQSRLQLDLLLELNGAGEPSVSPGFLLRMQQRASAAPSSPGPKPGGSSSARPYTGPKRPMEGASRYATPMQSVEARSKQ